MAKKKAAAPRAVARTAETATPPEAFAAESPAPEPPAPAVPPAPAPPPSAPAPSHYRDLATYKFLFILVLILGAIAWIGLDAQQEGRVGDWLMILGLMAAFAVVTGRAITGYWRGILIDARNKLSLSRLQMLSWSLVILSAIFTAAMSNIAFGWQSPMDIEIPSQLWVVMGISTASLVASPAILSSKAQKTPRPDAVAALEEAGADRRPEGLLACNNHPQDARWADLLMGEELGNYSHVDLGKMQMFFFTFILIVGYGAAIGAMFQDIEVVSGLPEIQEGMGVLLGISHTGYLANKTVSHTGEA